MTQQPNSSAIPVIDISGTESQTSIAAELVDAAVTHGFVFIKNKGQDIPVSAINGMFDLSRSFFASPQNLKEEFAIKEKNHGWIGMHAETLDATNQRTGDFKEAFNFGEFTDGKAQQSLPDTFAAVERDLSDFSDSCHNLCLKILTLFGLGLSIAPPQGGSSWFSSRHSRSLGPSGCTLRLLYYPSIPESVDYQPEVDIRAGAHSDYGSITLLFQRPGQPGLQILKTGGTWAPVPVTPEGTEDDPSPPILVNIGDLLSYWTNGLFKSTVHRVIFPKDAKRGGEDRYSIAYFCHPADSTVLEAVPSSMVASRKLDTDNRDHASNGKVMTAREHLLDRLKATYLSLKWDDEK